MAGRPAFHHRNRSSRPAAPRADTAAASWTRPTFSTENRARTRGIAASTLKNAATQRDKRHSPCTPSPRKGARFVASLVVPGARARAVEAVDAPRRRTGPRRDAAPQRAPARRERRERRAGRPCRGGRRRVPARDSNRLARTSTRARVRAPAERQRAPERRRTGACRRRPRTRARTIGRRRRGRRRRWRRSDDDLARRELVREREADDEPGGVGDGGARRALERARRRPVDAAQLERRAPVRRRRARARRRRTCIGSRPVGADGHAARDRRAHRRGVGAARGRVPAQLDRQRRGAGAAPAPRPGPRGSSRARRRDASSLVRDPREGRRAPSRSSASHAAGQPNAVVASGFRSMPAAPLMKWTNSPQLRSRVYVPPSTGNRARAARRSGSRRPRRRGRATAGTTSRGTSACRPRGTDRSRCRPSTARRPAVGEVLASDADVQVVAIELGPLALLPQASAGAPCLSVGDALDEHGRLTCGRITLGARRDRRSS